MIGGISDKGMRSLDRVEEFDWCFEITGKLIEPG